MGIMKKIETTIMGYIMLRQGAFGFRASERRDEGLQALQTQALKTYGALLIM